MCADPGPEGPFAGYCTAPHHHPEQINLQIADPTTVVVAFVTYEALPAGPPVAMLGTDPSGAKAVQKTGVSHAYNPPGRSYVLSFIKFDNLAPRTNYTYKVRSGSPECSWSQQYTFRSGYADGVTRLATYGDMGHSHHSRRPISSRPAPPSLTAPAQTT